MCQKEPVLQAGFGVEPVKELMHESGPFPGDAAARGRQHAAGQLAQFHQIFPVGGILAAVPVSYTHLTLPTIYSV